MKEWSKDCSFFFFFFRLVHFLYLPSSAAASERGNTLKLVLRKTCTILQAKYSIKLLHETRPLPDFVTVIPIVEPTCKRLSVLGRSAPCFRSPLFLLTVEQGALDTLYLDVKLSADGRGQHILLHRNEVFMNRIKLYVKAVFLKKQMGINT